MRTLPLSPRAYMTRDEGACAPSRYALTPLRPKSERRDAMYHLAVDSPPSPPTQESPARDPLLRWPKSGSSRRPFELRTFWYTESPVPVELLTP